MSEHVCVRCGRAPRAHELFICLGCVDDPVRIREQSEVEADEHGSMRSGDEQRRELIERYHWAGGWPRYDRS